MALKSNREGLRRELVDYLGNIIIDKKLKQDIITAIDNVYVNESDVLTLEEIQASSDLSGKVASASALKTIQVAALNVESNVDNYSIFKSGNIVFGRVNFSYGNTKHIMDLPVSIVPGYFSCIDWNSGASISGNIYINNSGTCAYFGEVFTGVASCLFMYFCS